MNTQTDEAFARTLLEKYYGRTSKEPVSIELCRNDPPDLIVRRLREEIWGVEVTCVYDQAQWIGRGSAPDSSKSVSEALISFGDQVGDDTRDITKQNYTLFLSGPSPGTRAGRTVAPASVPRVERRGKGKDTRTCRRQ